MYRYLDISTPTQCRYLDISTRMEDAELLDGDEVGAGVGPGQDLLFRLSHNQGHLDREAAGLVSEPSINNQQ